MHECTLSFILKLYSFLHNEYFVFFFNKKGVGSMKNRDWYPNYDETPIPTTLNRPNIEYLRDDGEWLPALRGALPFPLGANFLLCFHLLPFQFGKHFLKRWFHLNRDLLHILKTNILSIILFIYVSPQSRNYLNIILDSCTPFFLLRFVVQHLCSVFATYIEFH